MGYMGLSSVGDSDTAADMAHSLGVKLIKDLRKAYREENSEYNTDGPVNVGLFLEEVRHTYLFSALEDYVSQEFLPKFKRYVDKQAKRDWGDSSNRRFHINAYRRIIRNLERRLVY